MTADSERPAAAAGVWLVLGGVRSGKSRLALTLTEEVGRRVVFVATGEAGDEEMRERIERHRGNRPQQWSTVEAPTNVARALEAELRGGEVVVLDCLGFLVANHMGDECERAADVESRLDVEIQDLLSVCARKRAILIVVSNEVGMGVVPAYPSGRLFRDLLGRANQLVARAADRVYWMVAGLPVEVKASGLAGIERERHGRP